MPETARTRRRQLPSLIRIHERYSGKPFAELVIEEYERLGSLERVAEELGTSMRTLIRWLPLIGLKLEKRLEPIDPDATDGDGAEPARGRAASAR